MIKMLSHLPRNLYVACSGGIDSMVALDFLSRKHAVTAVFYDHKTETSKNAFEFIQKYCNEKSIDLVTAGLISNKPKDESNEEFWRNSRYSFFDTLDSVVVTAHHLDDCVETWIWSSLNGNPKIPLYRKNNVVRPFLTTIKNDFIDWQKKNNVPFIQDLSNYDNKYTRNYIRNEMMHHVLKVNPGIHKVIKKKILKDFNDTEKHQSAH